MKRAVIVFLCLVACAWVVDASAQRMLTLEETVGIALDKSTFVDASRQNLVRARQGVLNSYGQFLPTANMSFYAGRTFFGPNADVLLDTQGRPIDRVGINFEQYNFGIRSNMTLWDWGANLNNLNSSKGTAEAAQHDLSWQKNITAARVIAEYYNLVRAKNLLVVQEEAVDVAQRNLAQVEAFYNIGSNTRADVLQAQVRVGTTRLQLITERNNVEIAKAQLASTLNFGLNQEIDVSGSLETDRIDPVLVDEVKYMLEARADLQAGRSRVKSASANLTATESSRWPTLAATMGYNWNNRIFPNNVNFFRNNYSWNIGVFANWDVFDGFQRKSSVLDAKAAERVAELNLRQAKLNAILEVKTLYLRLREAEERIDVSQEQVDQAAENLRLAGERYKVGAGTQLESNEAQVQLTQARSSLVEARIDYLIAKAELARATGRPLKAK